MLTTLLEMCFSNTTGGITVNLTAIGEEDIIKLLFSQNPGIIIQVKDEDEVADFLLEHGISYYSIGHPIFERSLLVSNNSKTYTFDINDLREKWFLTSYLLDCRQCGPEHAKERSENYLNHGTDLNLGSFKGKLQIT